jgi:hypothetical protein
LIDFWKEAGRDKMIEFDFSVNIVSTVLVLGSIGLIIWSAREGAKSHQNLKNDTEYINGFATDLERIAKGLSKKDGCNI